MIKLEMNFPDLAAKVKRYEQEIYLVLAAAMQTNRAMMFDKDGADNGKKKWAPLVLRKGRPLQKRGTLRKSFAPQNDGVRPGRGPKTVVRVSAPSVTIGTQLSYAKMMNVGTAQMPDGVLRPVRAKALKIPFSGSKKGFIFRKKVRIPARPMDIVTKQDEKEFAETVQNFIAEILSRG